VPPLKNRLSYDEAHGKTISRQGGPTHSKDRAKFGSISNFFGVEPPGNWGTSGNLRARFPKPFPLYIYFSFFYLEKKNKDIRELGGLISKKECRRKVNFLPQAPDLPPSHIYRGFTVR